MDFYSSKVCWLCQSFAEENRWLPVSVWSWSNLLKLDLDPHFLIVDTFQFMWWVGSGELCCPPTPPPPTNWIFPSISINQHSIKMSQLDLQNLTRFILDSVLELSFLFLGFYLNKAIAQKCNPNRSQTLWSPHVGVKSWGNLWCTSLSPMILPTTYSILVCFIRNSLFNNILDNFL